MSRREECFCCGQPLVHADPATGEGQRPMCAICIVAPHRHDNVPYVPEGPAELEGDPREYIYSLRYF